MLTLIFQEEDAKEIMYEAICGGVYQDAASGNWVDMCVVRNNFSVEYNRPYRKPNVKGQRQGSYQYKKGTTKVLKTQIIPIVVEETHEKRIDLEAMDTSS